LLNILIYSYLIFPVVLLLLKGKLKDVFFAMIVLYGLTFFTLIFINDIVPRNIKKYYHGFYTLVEYSFFTLIFWFNIHNKTYKRFAIIVTVLFFIFEIIYVLNARLQRLDSVPIGIETILIFIFVFCFFYDFSRTVKDTYIYNHYCFWLSVGILIYLGGSFFYYILVNDLDEKDVEKFGELTYVAELVKNLLFVVAMFVYKKYTLRKIHPKKIPNLDMNMI